MLNRRSAVFAVVMTAVTLAALAVAKVGTADSSTFNIMVITGIHVPVADYPEFDNGIHAAAQAINKKGGIGGKQIAITDCSTGSSNTIAAACAQQAVDQHMDWVLGYGSFLTPTFPILDAGHIPYALMSGTGTLDFKNFNEYPLLAPGQLSVAVGCWAAVKFGHKKKVAIILNDNASSLISKAACILGTKAAGGTFVGAVSTPATGTDFSAAVLKLKQLNPDVIGMSLAGAAQIAFLQTAVQFGLGSVIYAGTNFVMTETMLKTVGPLTYYGAAAVPVFRAKTMGPFLGDEQAANLSGDPINLQAPGGAGWAMMYALWQLSRKVTGTVTSAAMVAQIPKTTSINVKGIINWTPNQKGPALFPNNPWGGVYLAKSTPDGQLVPMTEKVIDGYQVLKIGHTPGLPAPPTSLT